MGIRHLGIAGALVVGLAVACGAGSDDLCGRLAGGSRCDGTATSTCTDALTKAKAAEPKCAALIDALAKCIAPLKLSCSGGAGIAANGTGDIGGGQNFTTIGDFSVVVNDAKCDIERRGLEACRTCPDAVGATTPSVLGVGDRCSTGTCAKGLSCQGGICTKSCTQDDDCDARADGCRLLAQYGNVCRDGKCTRACGDDYVCIAGVSSSSTCVNKACSL